MIEAFVTNLGKYNEGRLQGEYLKLPATTEEVQALFSRIGLDGIMYEEMFITDYETEVSGLKQHLGEYESLNELNYLASLLEEMDEGELEKLEAAIAQGEYAGSVQELINLTQNLDCYDFYSEVNDYEDLGHYLIEELGYETIPEHLQHYFDYESYGETHVINEGGEILKGGGFIFHNDEPFTEIYKGRADLPEEHKIFAYPPMEKSISKAIAQFKQKISEIPEKLTPERLTPAHADR